MNPCPTRRVQEPNNSASLSGIREEGPTCRATRAPRNLSLYTQNSKPKRQKLPNPPSDSVGFPSWEINGRKKLASRSCKIKFFGLSLFWSPSFFSTSKAGQVCRPYPRGRVFGPRFQRTGPLRTYMTSLSTAASDEYPDFSLELLRLYYGTYRRIDLLSQMRRARSDSSRHCSLFCFPALPRSCVSVSE